MDLIPVAARRMPIMRAGERVVVEPGDPVPEAAAWSHVKAWERQGYIRWVPAPPSLAAKLKEQAAQPTAGPVAPEGPGPATTALETTTPSEEPKSARKNRGKAQADAAKPGAGEKQ